MSAPDPRAAYAAFTESLIRDFRANGGKVSAGPFAGRDVLLLATTGAKSGRQRLAPLVYTRDGDRYVIIASKRGEPSHPSWYLNLVANPIVTVEMGTEEFEARAVVVEGAERDRLYADRVKTYPIFGEYEERTTRRIPVILLERIP